MMVPRCSHFSFAALPRIHHHQLWCALLIAWWSLQWHRNKMRGCGGYGAINGRMTSACPILSRRSVCQACDSRGADIRPDFPQARMGTGWRMVGPPRAL